MDSIGSHFCLELNKFICKTNIAFELSSAPTERKTKICQSPKSVGAAARRRVLANIQAAFRNMSCTERLPEKIID